MAPRRTLRGLWCLAALLSLTCAPAPVPGDEDMGLYLVAARGGVRQCALDEVKGDDFDFDVAFSRLKATNQTFMTIDGVSRSAEFDGQRVDSVATAPRVFAACGACNTRIIERVSVAILSRSQAAAAGGRCPADPLDGGVTAPGGDAGVTLPGQTAEGYDAILVCGELSSRVVSDGLADGGACDPACSACTVAFTLTGARR